MDDFDRPLGEQGLADATMMGRRLADRKEAVDLVVASTARRTRETALLFRSALGSIDHREEPRIYAANTTRLMDIINGLPEGSGHVMLVGHNPAVTELVEELSDAHLGHLVPCTIVRIDLEAERWSEVARGTGTMVWWDSPKRG